MQCIIAVDSKLTETFDENTKISRIGFKMKFIGDSSLTELRLVAEDHRGKYLRLKS